MAPRVSFSSHNNKNIFLDIYFFYVRLHWNNEWAHAEQYEQRELGERTMMMFLMSLKWSCVFWMGKRGLNSTAGEQWAWNVAASLLRINLNFHLLGRFFLSLFSSSSLHVCVFPSTRDIARKQATKCNVMPNKKHEKERNENKSNSLPWKVFLCYQQTIFFLHELRKLSHQARARFPLCVFCCHLSCLRRLHHKARREEVKSLRRRNMLEVFTISNFGLHTPTASMMMNFSPSRRFWMLFCLLAVCALLLVLTSSISALFVWALTQLFVCVLFGKSKWWAGKRDMWCRGAYFSHYLRIYETNEWAGGLRGWLQRRGEIWWRWWVYLKGRMSITHLRKKVHHMWKHSWDKSTEQVWDVVFILFRWWK